MGRLILCSLKKADKPYYIKSLNINLYTIEELCYYLQNNIYLIDENVISEELLDWIEKELLLSELADGLRAKRSSVKSCVLYILKSTGYSSVDDIENTGRLLTEIEGQSDIQKRKLKAAHLLKNKKYTEAIFEFRKICEEQEEEELEIVYNNMGSAYAGMFLFAEAAKFFSRAYLINRNEDIYRRLMYAMAMMPKAKADKLASDNGITDDYNAVFKADRMYNENNSKLERYESLVKLKEDGKVQEYFSELNSIITEWKNEYNNYAFQR